MVMILPRHHSDATSFIHAVSILPPRNIDDDLAGWREFVREAFLDAKVHKGLLEMINSEDADCEGWASTTLAQFTMSSEHMYLVHGITPSLRLL